MATSKRLAKKETKEKKPRTKKKVKAGTVALLWIGTIIGIICIAYIGFCCKAASTPSIYDHVTVMGIDLSGMTYQEAMDAWDGLSTDVCEKSIIAIQEDGKEITSLPLTDLGVSMAAEQAVNKAWNKCHGGNFFENGNWYIYSLGQTIAEKLAGKSEQFKDLPAKFTDLSMMVDMDVDDGVLKGIANHISDEMNCTYVDGEYLLTKDGPDGPGLYIVKPRDGRQIDADALYTDLKDIISSGVLKNVECQFKKVEAKKVDLQAIYDEYHAEMINAKYDHATGQITQSSVGVDFDVAELKKELEKAEEGKQYKTSAKVEYPIVSSEDLNEVLFRDVLGTCTTNVSGSSARLNNVRLAAKKIDGVILNPGEQLWYNNTVGKRTVERGFQAAPAYVGGKTVDEVGGGICQVSSTLYYATLLADLKIVLRYAHQFAPSYITFGCDATVSWGGPDFAFENNTNYPIKVVTSYNDNKLTVTVYGTKVDDHYVEMASYVLSRTDYEVEYVENPELQIGESFVEQTPYTGYLVNTYRNVYAGDGTLISSDFEAKSNYDKRNKIIQQNTGMYGYMPAFTEE